MPVSREVDEPRSNLVVVFLTDLRSDPTVENADAQAQLWLDGTELGLTDEPISVGPDSTLFSRINPNPQGGYSDDRLYIVFLHEIGHFLGLDHCLTGEPSCMEPRLDRRVTTPQSWEIAQVQAKYGPPQIAVTPAQQAVLIDPKQSPLSGSQTLTLTIPGVGLLDLTVSAWNFRKA